MWLPREPFDFEIVSETIAGGLFNEPASKQECEGRYVAALPKKERLLPAARTTVHLRTRFERFITRPMLLLPGARRAPLFADIPEAPKAIAEKIRRKGERQTKKERHNFAAAQVDEQIQQRKTKPQRADVDHGEAQ